MEENNRLKFVSFFSKDLLISLLGVLSFFLIGTGNARYLGYTVDIRLLFFGFSTVFFLILTAYLLKEFFDVVDPEIRKKNGIKLSFLEEKRRFLVLSSLIALSMASTFAYIIFVNLNISSGVKILLVFVFLLVFLYAVPPFRLSAKGYGEYLISVIIGIVIPAFAFLLQTNIWHKLIPQITIPLAALYLAMLISTSLERYLNDMISGRKSILIVAGWNFGMGLHNALIFFAFGLLILEAFMGLAWNIVWPLLLPLPIFVITVYELIRIKAGNKPNWTLISFTSYSGMAIVLYLTLFTFWFK